MKIDLRSDTVTRPVEGMLAAMMNAEVGDDVLGEDPTVHSLEEKTANIFGKSAGLFCPSGTMTNQIAIKVHTQPGDEVICSMDSHIYRYEGGGIAMNSGSSVCLLSGDRGRFTAQNVQASCHPNDPLYPRSRLVCVEDTCNRGGGSIWNIKELHALQNMTKEHHLSFHLDGARVFHRFVETKESCKEYGALFDTLSICLSKGLGAPVGSVLIGDKDFIHQARRVRKVFGGGMRQAGYLAAAGLYALENHIDRLIEDNRRAKNLGQALAQRHYVKEIVDVETNIVLFSLHDAIPVKSFLAKLGEHGILAESMYSKNIRFVTHLQFNDDMMEKTIDVLKTLE